MNKKSSLKKKAGLFPAHLLELELVVTLPLTFAGGGSLIIRDLHKLAKTHECLSITRGHWNVTTFLRSVIFDRHLW
jgi:hypothetical protein